MRKVQKSHVLLFPSTWLFYSDMVMVYPASKAKMPTNTRKHPSSR